MLNLKADAVIAEPDRTGAPEVSLDGQTLGFRTVRPAIKAGLGGTGASWCCFEVVLRAILHPKACRGAVHLGNVR